jgi:hypothetical protein
MILEQIAPYVEGRDGRRILWKLKPHSTWDNHFSNIIMVDWLGNEGNAAKQRPVAGTDCQLVFRGSISTTKRRHLVINTQRLRDLSIQLLQ